MPDITPVDLREHIERDLPGIVVPVELPPEVPETLKHGAKPNLLATRDTVVVAERIVEAATYLRDTLGYTFLSDLAVVDYLSDGIFELVYRFYHLDGGGDLVLKVRVPRDRPEVPALTPIWPGADLNEREAFDLYGIIFTGHPFLTRIYMWDEFEGYPMRKDFPKQGDKYLDEA